MFDKLADFLNERGCSNANINLDYFYGEIVISKVVSWFYGDNDNKYYEIKTDLKRIRFEEFEEWLEKQENKNENT